MGRAGLGPGDEKWSGQWGLPTSEQACSAAMGEGGKVFVHNTATFGMQNRFVVYKTGFLGTGSREFSVQNPGRGTY